MIPTNVFAIYNIKTGCMQLVLNLLNSKLFSQVPTCNLCYTIFNV